MNTKTLAMAAAALSATVFCGAVQADITSANIVGYSTVTTPGEDGFKALMPTFVDVDDDANISLANIKGEFSRGDTLQVFDGDGNVNETFTWKTRSGSTGWFDDDNVLVTDTKKFPRGTSFWICAGDTVDVTTSGEVNGKALTLQLLGDDSFTQIGNFMAVPVKLGSLEFSDVARGDTIQYFDQDGNVEKSYTWKTRSGVTGWFNDDNESMMGTDLQPGEAFWVCCGTAGTVKFPAVNL